MKLHRYSSCIKLIPRVECSSMYIPPEFDEQFMQVIEQLLCWIESLIDQYEQSGDTIDDSNDSNDSNSNEPIIFDDGECDHCDEYGKK